MCAINRMKIKVLFTILLLLPTIVYGTDTIDMDFDNVLIKELVFTVSKYTGIGFVFSDAVSTPISWTQKSIDQKDILKSFIAVLESSGYVVRSLNDEKTIYSIDITSSLQSDSENAVGVYTFKNISIDSILDVSEALYGEKLKVGSVVENDTVVCTGSDSLVTSFTILLSQIDTPKSNDILSYRLKNITVKSAYNALLQSKVIEKESYYPDYWNRSLIVKGSKEEKIIAEAILRAIDLPQQGWVDKFEYVNSSNIEMVTEVLNTVCGDVEIRQTSENGVLLSGLEQDVDNAILLLHKIDGSGLQVKVEAVIAYLTDEQFYELGIRLAYEKEQQKIALNDSIVSSLILQNTGVLVDWVTDYLGFQVAAESGTGNGTIISSPVITVLNGSEASLHVGQEVPYISKENYNSDDEKTSNSIERKDVGLSLIVQPQIHPNGEFVRLQISQEISSLVDDSMLSADTVDVVFNKQDIQTTVNMADGDILFIGGLKTQETGTNVNSIPFISELPVIGSMFTYKKQKTQNRNLVVSLKVKILNGV